MVNQAEVLHKALISAGDDYARTRVGEKALGTGVGLYALLHEEPVALICERLSQKLEDRGYRLYRVTKLAKNGKLD